MKLTQQTLRRFGRYVEDALLNQVSRVIISLIVSGLVMIIGMLIINYAVSIGVTTTESAELKFRHVPTIIGIIVYVGSYIVEWIWNKLPEY